MRRLFSSLALLGLGLLWVGACSQDEEPLAPDQLSQGPTLSVTGSGVIPPPLTLLQVLQQGGGGLNALGRHAVAALLNAKSAGVDYDLSPLQVIRKFNRAHPNGNIQGTKNLFESFNEQSCPLGGRATR